MTTLAPITDGTVAFLLSGSGARRTHGDATLTIENGAFVMRKPGAEHRLSYGSTGLSRLNAHWSGFVGEQAYPLPEGMNLIDAGYVEQGYELPAGYTWPMVQENRARWGIDAHMVPLAVSPAAGVTVDGVAYRAVCGWGVPYINGKPLDWHDAAVAMVANLPPMPVILNPTPAEKRDRFLRLTGQVRD